MTYNESDAQAIIDFWRRKGFNDFAIAAWLANWYVESGLRSDNAQNSYMKKYGITDEEYCREVNQGTWKRPDTGAPFTADSIGFGLSQWTSSGRKTGLYNYIKGLGKPIEDRAAQMEYAYIELTSGGYKKTYNDLLNASNVADPTISIMVYYERPASKDDPKAQQVRVSYAQEFFEKYFGGKKMDKVLAISAGHYLFTSGKRCLKSIDPTETREWVLNARIADKLTVMLNRYDGIKIVRLDDPTGQTSVSLEQRAKMSDSSKADVYLAIHHNAGAKGTSAGGTVVYYYPKAVNKAAATKMYELLIKYTGLKGNRANPIKETKKLYEVYKPKAQSLLVENGFMDSTTDTPIILTEAHAEKTAQAMCEYFVTTWGLKLKEDESKSDILAEIESCEANIKALEERIKELKALL